MDKKRILSALTVMLMMVVLIIVAAKNSVWKHARGNIAAEDIQKGQPEIKAEAKLDTAQALYEDISRSLVHVAVKQSAGTGIIWDIGQDKVVIASNRHVLTGDVEAEVTFADGNMLTAQALGYSAQYDVAFFEIGMEDIPAQMLQTITEARRPLEIAWEERTQGDTPIMQAAANEEYYEGTIIQTRYIPEFGTDMLCTSCYAKAGMSGGGVFDSEGWLLGMITGGEAADSGNKEAWVTYSIPVTVIEQEYATVQGYVD